MSDIKRVKNYHRSRRTGKILETIIDRERRYNEMLRLLDQKADLVLANRQSKRKKAIPTKNELDQMAKHKPEIAEMLIALFDVAERIAQSGESAPASAIDQAQIAEGDTSQTDPLTAPKLPENITDLATIIRGKNYRR